MYILVYETEMNVLLISLYLCGLFFFLLEINAFLTCLK